MPKVTYIESNGTTHFVGVAVGLSVTRGTVNNNVPGIDADARRCRPHVRYATSAAISDSSSASGR
jgi:hypothetical protein